MKTIHYKLDGQQSKKKLLQISVDFPVTNETTLLQLPSWRPGRYELGNFAKNVLHFSVFDEHKKKCSFQKINKDTWLVKTPNTKTITVRYSYYANELNAGSTFIDKEIRYVNPVNCLLYADRLMENPITLQVEHQKDWQIASSLTYKNGLLHAANYNELADSPFIISPNLQSESYSVNNTQFTIWIVGHKPMDWENIIYDFKKFTQHQFDAFGEFPFNRYDFLIFSLPYHTYHGVEHLKSTVITLGPSHAIFNRLYSELLGISSHELYHAWNIKSIRPKAMLPYDLKSENYSRLGYIYEGVTTYMGDLFLLKSGFFTLNDYLNELTNQVQKHLDNQGRFNYSVAESSFDTWLDGYVPGVPGRKVSIYTEGCLLAFCIDVKIRKATNNKMGLDEVMKRLYYDFAVKGIGITETDYQTIIENTAGISFQAFFDEYINGTNPYESILIDCLDYLGLSLIQEILNSYSKSKLGIRTTKTNKGILISEIFPGSPADIAGLSINDQIIAINDHHISNDLDDLDELLDYFDAEEKKVLFSRNQKILELTLPEVNRFFYQKHSVRLQNKLSKNQEKALLQWSK